MPQARRELCHRPGLCHWQLGPRAAWPPCEQALVSKGTVRTDGDEAVATERWVLENVCRFVALTFTAGNGTP